MVLKLIIAAIATGLLAALFIGAIAVALVSTEWGFDWDVVILAAAVATYAAAFAFPTSITLALFVYFGRQKHWPVGLWPLLGIGFGAGFIFPRLFSFFVQSLGRLTAWALPTGVLVALIFWLIVRPDRAAANPPKPAS